MTIKKILLGKPGNLQEFAETARLLTRFEKKVDVVIRGWKGNECGGLTTLIGTVIYSCGTKEEVIAGTNLRLAKTAHKGTGPYQYQNGKLFLIGCEQEIQPDLDYLKKMGLSYTLHTIDEIENFL